MSIFLDDNPSPKQVSSVNEEVKSLINEGFVNLYVSEIIRDFRNAKYLIRTGDIKNHFMFTAAHGIGQCVDLFNKAKEEMKKNNNPIEVVNIRIIDFNAWKKEVDGFMKRMEKAAKGCEEGTDEYLSALDGVLKDVKRNLKDNFYKVKARDVTFKEVIKAVKYLEETNKKYKKFTETIGNVDWKVKITSSKRLFGSMWGSFESLIGTYVKDLQIALKEFIQENR